MSIDVFPFLDRVVYLCLGDVVYAGPTRNLLDYFGSIGFPCPQLENPLMYYCKCYDASLFTMYIINYLMRAVLLLIRKLP